MTQKFSLKLLSFAVATTLTLTACGGGGNDSNSTSNNSHSQQQPTTAIGKFVDSAVEGLEVFQDGKSLGKTNAKGEYTYVIKGGPVTFKIGTLVLGSTIPKSIITPADLTTDNQQLVRTLQILQSVDKDNQPKNGITIDNTVAARFSASDFQSLLQEDDDDKFEQTLQKKLNHGQMVVSSQKSLEHFKNTSTSELAQSPELVDTVKAFAGYWANGCKKNHKTREVYKIEVQGNRLQVVDSKVHKYDNEQCSGNPIDSTKIDKNNQALIFTGTGNINSVNVMQALKISQDGFSEPVSVYSGNNFMKFKHNFLQRVESLDNPTPIVHNNATEVKKVAETLQGYWQSKCEKVSDDGQINENHRSIQDFKLISKLSDNRIQIDKQIEVYFTDNNCQSVDMVTADTRSRSFIVSDPQTINGLTSATINSNGELFRLTLLNNIKISVGNKINDKTSKTVFDNWLQQANIILE